MVVSSLSEPLVSLQIKGADILKTKTRKPLLVIFPHKINPRLDAWLDLYRPILLGKEPVADCFQRFNSVRFVLITSSGVVAPCRITDMSFSPRLVALDVTCGHSA